MTCEGIIGNLFDCPKEYYLAHCISGDYALGAGIAKEFNRRYDMRTKLKELYPVEENHYSKYIGYALLVDNVFNLVTKERYWHKPTKDSMRNALVGMMEICKEYGIKKLAMPKIGAGLDKMPWNTTFKMISDIFCDTDIDIVIYKL